MMNRFLKSTIILPILLQASLSSAVENNTKNVYLGNGEAKDFNIKANEPPIENFGGYRVSSVEQLQKTVEILNYGQVANNLNNHLNYHTTLHHKGYLEAQNFTNLLEDSVYQHNIFDKQIAHNNLQNKINVTQDLFFIALFFSFLYSILFIKVILKDTLRKNFFIKWKISNGLLKNQISKKIKNILFNNTLLYESLLKIFHSMFFGQTINLKNI